MNFGLIFYIIGYVLLITGGSMIIPLITALIYAESVWVYFAVIGGISAILGLTITLFKPKRRIFRSKDGFFAVAFGWIIMSLISCLPYYLSGQIPSFVDALFETVSGYTTTGASILTNVEGLSRSMLMWRSFAHFIGGMGVLVFILAILPLSEGSNVMLMKAESPGPTTGKLVPKIKTTAFYLYAIYVVLMLVEIVALLIAKMPLFDAITISFGTAGTGGLTVRNSGMLDYSMAQQIIITVFMFLFGVNFTVYYLILTKKFRQVFMSEELKMYFIVYVVAVLVIAFNVVQMFSNFGEALHHASFQVSSIMTTTGYATFDFDKWPALSKTILVLLMFMGAMGGSTGGGIKVSRVLIAVKSALREIKTSVRPKKVSSIMVDKRPLEESTVRAINVYFVVYGIIFIISMLLISLDNFDFTTNFTAITATLNNIGPGLNMVGPMQNYASFSDLSKMVMVFDMLIGRLELYPILALFYVGTWKN
ncbi:MAG: TrkH family potassium uptake protein [Clostridia bacterium]|nr:TrkH family potassium uptake protein [Clostridia bacterium]